MRVVRDFKCECGSITERFIDSLETEIECPECGGRSFKTLSCPRIMLDGTDPSLPGAYEKWGRDRENRAKQNAKRNS